MAFKETETEKAKQKKKNEIFSNNALIIITKKGNKKKKKKRKRKECSREKSACESSNIKRNTTDTAFCNKTINDETK